MMAAFDEEVALRRVETLATARRMLKEWGYWCYRGASPGMMGQTFSGDCAIGSAERRYRAPPQWYPPEPRMPDADENTGLAVQSAFAVLPQIYRLCLRAEYCMRPWMVGMEPDEVFAATARKARQSIGAYPVTLERSELALSNVMRRKGTWRY